MKYFFVAITFLCGINIAFAGEISQFVFASDQQTVKPNEISKQITIQSQDIAGDKTNILQTACLELKTTSATGEFSSNDANWVSVTKLTMSKNTANKNFYYKDSTSGNYVLTAKIALRPETETRSCVNWPVEEWNAQWTVSQNIIISSDSTTVVEPPPQQKQISGADSFPVEPQIFAEAGEDRIGAVGTNVYFSGKGFDLEKKLLVGKVRYIWSFGDGATKEGQNVAYSYKYPGEYIAVLNISSGQYSAIDTLNVKIFSNQIKITEANKDFIKLQNGLSSDINLSGWFLKSGYSQFKFPELTFIKAGSFLTMASSITGLKIDSNKVDLLYPNFSLADSYTYVKPTYDVGSNSQQKENKESKVQNDIKKDVQKEEEILNNKNQTANVASVVQNDTQNSDEKTGSKGWLALSFGIGLVAGLGMVFIRRKTFPKIF